MTNEILFEQVESEAQKKTAGALIREYLEWLNERLQREYGLSFEVEAMVTSDLEDGHKFHPPDGRFYLAVYQGQAAGVGCLKKLSPGVGEVQRMYVLPRFRGKGIGRAIIQKLIEEARAEGYRQLRLESLRFLEEAHRLYHSIGFKDTDPYADHSMTAYQAADQLGRYYGVVVFMAMEL